jgi:hypothetical protein
MRGRTMRPRRQDLTCPGARPTRQNRAFAERVAANTFAVGPAQEDGGTTPRKIHRTAGGAHVPAGLFA